MSYTAESMPTIPEIEYGRNKHGVSLTDNARHSVRYEPHQLESVRRFYSDLKRWREATADLSSLSAIVNDDAYKRIIGMGLPALPLIFVEMQREPDFWFDALRSITGIGDDEDPVRPEDRGNLQAMTSAWLEWATRNEYV